jgi:hypothetical protein
VLSWRQELSGRNGQGDVISLYDGLPFLIFILCYL